MYWCQGLRFLLSQYLPRLTKMMSLPQLLDGLGRGRLDVVKKALNSHHTAFRSEFLRHLAQGANSLTEEHIKKMAIVLETFMNHFQKSEKKSPFVHNVLKLVIDHINILRQELEGVTITATLSSIQQKRAVLELLDFHGKYFEKILLETFLTYGEVQPCTDSPSEPRGSKTVADIGSSSKSETMMKIFSFKTDEDVVKHALLSSDAVSCAKQILLSRGKGSAQIADFVHSVADAYIIELLHKKQIDVAKDVLRNTDKDIWPSLKSICLHTIHSDIRDFLALELNSISLLEPVETDAWKFLILVEGITKNFQLGIKVKSGSLSLVKTCDQESPPEPLESTVSIASLLSLPTTCRASLLMELYFETLDGTLEPMLNKEESWKFLLFNNKLEILIKWVQISCSPQKDLFKSDRLISFLSSWDLSQDMIDYITKSDCSYSTKECLLDFLSKFNVYTTEESCNIHKLLSRALHTSQICKSLDERVKDLLVEFCIEYNLPDLMVSCDILTDKETGSWTKLYSKHKTLSQISHLKSSVRESIEIINTYLKSAQSSNHWVSLAVSLLSDKLLSDVVNETSIQDSQYLCETLKHHIQLSEKDPQKSDISLQLLLQQKYSCPKSHQIPKQQSLCRMFRDGPHEEEMDFSHEALIVAHGHHETLDFQYFIKQSRPCFAAMLVLSELICSFGKPPPKMLKRASQSAHETAFHHIMDQRITSSCIAFLEMLGETSLNLRLHVAAVNHVMSHNEISEKILQDTNDSYLLPWQRFLENGKAPEATELLEMLDILQCSIPMDVHMVGLAVQFATIYRLPPPTSFLTYCAQKNDWMSFLLFAQIYGYTPDLVRYATTQFQSIPLREHFKSLLLTDLTSMRPLLKSPSESPRHKVTQQFSSCEFHASKEAPSVSPGLFCHADDVFAVLLTCHGTADPAEAMLQACVEMPSPILAVLADFYKANIVDQLVVWLISWLSPNERAGFEYSQKNKSWPPEVLTSIIIKSLEESSSNLTTAFKIFLPEHPLMLVMEVIEEFNRNTSCSLQVLQNFREESLKLNSDDAVTADSCCLYSSSYVLSVGVHLLLNYLNRLPSAKNKIQLLQILCQANILSTPDGTPFHPSKLVSILDILSSSEIQLDVHGFITDNTKEVLQCIDKLIAQKLYKDAVKLAAVGIDEKVTLALVEAQSTVVMQNDKFERWLDSKYQDFKSFFSECSTCFEEAEVNPLIAFNFFTSCASKLERSVDRWRAYHNAKKWFLRASFPSNESLLGIEQTETELWQCCMTANDQTIFNVLAEELKPSPLNAMCTEELGFCNTSFPDNFHECGMLCDTQQCDYRDTFDLINCLLDIGDVVSATHVKRLFRSNHPDLTILATCISIMDGMLSVEEIPLNWALSATVCLADVKSLVWSAHASPKNCFGEEFPTSTLDSDVIRKEENKKVLLFVQELCKFLKHGKQISKQLAACFRLSLNLDLSYKEVISIADPLKLLRTAISQKDCDNYSVASDIMIAMRLSTNECTKFLSREITAAISKKQAQDNVKGISMWGLDMEQNFHHLLELVPDTSFLGNELTTIISKLAVSGKTTPKTVLNTAVELLVRAHDCYAAACHMEGVSRVLRTVRSTACILTARSEWALLVRLLTGIQRYTEMNFIFKILKENDQFEYLLRKDSVKPLGFKLALIDWLRRECANDTGLLKMTAAHFKMHKEEAELWAKEGSDCLSEVIQHGLFNNLKTKSALQTAMQDFSHASECYLQANMLHHAMTCAHQAELVALQLHLLSIPTEPSPLRVIVLDSKSVSKVIISTLGFNEALIVARAYNHRVDWAAVLFYHCVSPGLAAQEYFSAWSSCMELTPSLIQNIAYRLQRTAGITREMTSNMRWLLGHVQDMDVRYNIASLLGLKDVVESLLQAPEVAYLKDTVWQSGFKR